MVKATFEHDGNSGRLKVITHFDQVVELAVDKQDDETFRLGGTAINDVAVHEGLILKLSESPEDVRFKAFYDRDRTFEDVGVLSVEAWSVADLHCYVTEYYPLDMEGNRPGWFISKSPIQDANYLFVNLDILDGGGNTVRRFRVSPFTGEYKLMRGLLV